MAASNQLKGWRNAHVLLEYNNIIRTNKSRTLKK